MVTIASSARAELPIYTGNENAGQVVKGEILDLHPLQFAVGYLEVEDRIENFEEMEKWEFKEYRRINPIKVVIGPEGVPYIVDRHHMARAFYEMERETGRFLILRNLSHLSETAFFKELARLKWSYLFDQNGEPKSWKDLPKTVKGFKNDKHRSLTWLVRKAGGFLKSTIPYAEFQWAQFFRKRIKLGSDPGEIYDAVEEGLVWAKSEEARDLPGAIKQKYWPRKKVNQPVKPAAVQIRTSRGKCADFF